MKAYKYILQRALISVIGVVFIITLIDLSFNFFSQLEDIGANYSYADAVKFLLQTQPFRSREFIYLCSVVGLLLVFTDTNFLQSFNTLRQSGMRKLTFAFLAFLPIASLNLLSFEFIVPDLTINSFEERKQKINQSSKQKPQMIEIQSQENSGYSIIYQDGAVTFSGEGDVLITEDKNNSFNEINYNSNLKYLSFSELIKNSSSSFENFNLIVKTELIRRGLNFIAYFFIFLIGLEILLGVNKGFNTNRILIYGFGASLLYSFLEALVADSITVFKLPFYLQAFPLLLVIPYFYIKRKLSF